MRYHSSVSLALLSDLSFLPKYITQQIFRQLNIWKLIRPDSQSKGTWPMILPTLYQMGLHHWEHDSNHFLSNEVNSRKYTQNNSFTPRFFTFLLQLELQSNLLQLELQWLTIHLFTNLRWLPLHISHISEELVVCKFSCLYFHRNCWHFLN